MAMGSKRQSARLFAFIVTMLPRVTVALDNGLGLTPARGWNSWNPFRCEGLHEDLIKEVADAMVSTGLRDAGYVYVNIDDCWMAPKRSADGHLQPHPKRFPSGMKALGDYLHERGLKFGIYSCAGEMTCEGWPASFDHEHVDAQDWASWGVDYLKYDFCGLDKVPSGRKEPQALYSVMRDALNATGRPILYSLCNWGVGGPHVWGHKVGNSWRTGRDVFSVWDEHTAREVLRLPGFLQSVMTAIEQQAAYHPHVGPGGFNDPDMLVVGLDGMTPYGIVEKCPSHLPAGSCKPGDYVSREAWGSVGGLTYTEQRTHFAFWCMLASPLMLGNDPRHMSAATKRILTAPGMLDINQDPLGKQARRVWRDGELQIWLKELADGTHALLLFNGGDTKADIVARWKRDLPEASRPHEVETPRYPPCSDRADVASLCAGWVKGGECEKNAGYMKGSCRASCGACPPAVYEGRQATAYVRNAWEMEDEGSHVAMYTALHVEPHEARVLVVSFDPPAPPAAARVPARRASGRASGSELPARSPAGLSKLHAKHAKRRRAVAETDAGSEGADAPTGRHSDAARAVSSEGAAALPLESDECAGEAPSLATCGHHHALPTLLGALLTVVGTLLCQRMCGRPSASRQKARAV